MSCVLYVRALQRSYRVCLRFLRSTTISISPCSSKNSAVWNPWGKSAPIVCLITLGPAKPIIAPGSAIIISPKNAKLALTPPKVGLQSNEIKGSFASLSLLSAQEVFAICKSEKVDSCILAPPLVEQMISAWRFLIARFIARTIFSPSTDPSEPPINSKSNTTSCTFIPCMLALPAITALGLPVFVCASWTRFL